MGGRVALVLALWCGAAGLSACGGGGGNPGECSGSVEVCSEGREDGAAATTTTTTTSGIGGFSPLTNPAPAPAGDTGGTVIPVNAGSN